MCVGVLYIFDRFDKKALVGQRVANKKNSILFMCTRQQHANDIFVIVSHH
jgi:hypothetical protein